MNQDPKNPDILFRVMSVSIYKLASLGTVKPENLDQMKFIDLYKHNLKIKSYVLLLFNMCPIVAQCACLTKNNKCVCDYTEHFKTCFLSQNTC